MLVRFLAKRVAVCAAAAAAASLVLDGGNPMIAVGIALGAVLSVYKVRLNTLVVQAAGQGSGRGRTTGQIFLLFVPFGLLLACILVDVRLFGGVAGGLLLVPLVICANAVTEAAGLTHNGWGGAVGG